MIAPRPSDNWEQPAPASMRALLGVLIGERRRLVVALGVGSMLSGITEAGILACVAEIAASLVGGAKRVHLTIGPSHLNPSVGTLIIVAFVFVVIRFALQGPTAILAARIASDVQASLRRSLFSAFTRASWSVQSQDREGHLQEIMTSQVLQATQGALNTTALINSSLTFLVLMASALALNVVVAVAVLGAAMLLFALLRPLNRLGARSARALSRAQMEYAGGIGEASRLAEETQVFGVGAAQRKRLNGLVGSARNLYFRTQLFNRLVPSIYQSLVYLILVAGLAALHAAGSRQVASLGAVVLLVIRAGTYGQTVQGAYQSLRQSLPFLERLREAERRYTESAPHAGRLALARVETLAFEHASFSYRPGKPVLTDISFAIARGEAVGIIGPSGAGKSTLVQIILQLRTPDEGAYLVNGVPVQEFSREDWHKQIAYVPQEPRLLHASVAANIRYFRDLDDDAVQRASRLARIHDDVIGWADGYDTIIGPRADAVSGGQQQRICLARALAGRPQVLVLDEPTSALDPKSEMLIQESLTALKQELTLIIIAHRMSTLDMCGRLMVVVNGRLVAFDTKARLQTHNAYYQSASLLTPQTSERTSS
jgi:ATP-binding cassette subfamily B protein